MARKSTSKKGKKKTPLMQQYEQVKGKYPDAILLFRVGDFYETFGPDAVTAARVLGIVQTKRNNGGSDVELAGFPYHSLDLYLPRLVQAGYRVAICEQLEKPSPQKKIVKRGVTEVVTPGVATNEKLLNHKSNNFLASIAFGKKGEMGISFLDVSTGEMLVSEGPKSYIAKLLQSFTPSEVIFGKPYKGDYQEAFGDQYYTYPLEDWAFGYDFGREQLLTHFDVQNLKGYGIEKMLLAQIAAGATLHYLATTEKKNLAHITGIGRIQPDKYVWLDPFTIRNLELAYSNHEGGISLLNIMDQTISPMGARLMRKWVMLPLKNPDAIRERHDMVEYFYQNQETHQEIEQHVKEIGDLERLISRVPLGKINPREVVQLRRSLMAIKPIQEQLQTLDQDGLAQLGAKLDCCFDLTDLIGKQIVEEPPVNLAKGGVIADGVHEELDELRSIVKNAKDLLNEIRDTEAVRTGITSLKISFNNVFGYYLEVTNKYKNQVPEEWTRKQTLTNAERCYITEELKKLEARILGAEEKILILEDKLFQKLIFEMAAYIQVIQQNAKLIAQLDCLMSFARLAIKNRYCRPTIDDSFQIEIEAGRHPVIEKHLPPGEDYVPNNILLDNEDTQIMMITGPNMAGKSALLRQTALICLMAQMGSFVPANAARIGWIDKVFTRVGATDNISSGESTFMVEMNETANIMNNISPRSLILLDEIGRGTSTYDGISIAWSIAEFLHTNHQAHPKTLFATHYHELNELANRFERIKNYSIATREVGKKVIFLRKLIAGGSNHSFGIYVAKMAGMPPFIVNRANQILTTLEQKSIEAGDLTANKEEIKEQLKKVPSQPMQLSIFEAEDEVGKHLKSLLKDLDHNTMNTIERTLKLNEMTKEMGDG